MTLTEEQRDAVAFDLEKARASIAHYRIENPSNVDTESALKELVDQANLAEEYLDEIERLRADLEQSEICIRARMECIDDQAAYIKELESSLDEAETLTKKNAELMNAYLARITELEDALVEGLTNFLHYRASCYDPARRCPYAKECDDCSTWDACGHVEKFRSEARQQLRAAGKIGPGARPRESLYGKYLIRKSDGSPVDPDADYFVMRLDTDPVARRAAREYSYMTPDRDLALGLQNRIAQYDPAMRDCINLRFFGMEKPKVWQITKERVGLLRYCLDSLLDAPDIEESPGPSHSIEMLRTMLAEAGQ